MLTRVRQLLAVPRCRHCWRAAWAGTGHCCVRHWPPATPPRAA